eukprot:SAG11_NODE_1904_length_4088_cov_3.427676_1_plen_41_part_00
MYSTAAYGILWCLQGRQNAVYDEIIFCKRVIAADSEAKAQ